MMKVSGSKVAWAGALMLLAACGLLQVGSRFVKSQPMKAQEGGILAVAATENAMLGGLRLEVPPGALLTDTTITVELGLTDVTDSPWAAGPTVVLGPLNLTFATDVLLVLPIGGLESDSKISIAGIDGEGSSFAIDPSRVTVDAKAGLVSFKIRRLGSFQAHAEEMCRGAGSCSGGKVCSQRNRCEWPDAGCIATTETCNGLDDDCDGIVDDVDGAGCALDAGGYDGGWENDGGMPWCGGYGGIVCPNGEECVDYRGDSCEPNDGGYDCIGVCTGGDLDGGSACVPRTEVCNRIDDDCDGVIDNACDTDGGTDQDGGWFDPICVPQVESCNGIDDDCDGVVDNGCDADGGSAQDGGWFDPICVPQVEICNGIDDDCNGTVDDVPRGSC